MPSALLVPQPVPQMTGKTWRDVADYAARAGAHGRQRESDVAVVARLCRKEKAPTPK